MSEHEVKIIAEEWLNELIEELSTVNKGRLIEALDNNLSDKLNRSEELLYTFVKEFESNYKELPSAIIKIKALHLAKYNNK